MLFRSLQRIATPQRVLENASGLCIETTVTLASAIQSAGMNAMILLLPGHAQVAVELNEWSGEYILIETTGLDSFKNQAITEVMWYYNPAEWKEYIADEQVTAIDCDAAKILGIHPLG